jgi:diacylglycerol kinase family enzyme
MLGMARPADEVAGGTIPAYVNPAGGSAEVALEALERHLGFSARITPPERLTVALGQAVRAGVPRVLVAGGDGTISSAASVLAGTSTALAVLPGGTLNHFARDHGIPTDLDEALEVAVRGRVRRVDVGYVNDQLFLNTSSVGAYVRFVQTRDRLADRLGYWLASLVAGLRTLRGARSSRVTLEVEGEQRVYQARLVFIALGERSLTPPGLGRPTAHPGGALHVVIPRGRRQARQLARAFAGADRGLSADGSPLGLDTALVDRLRLDLSMPTAKVATDGEIRRQRTPLEYRLERGALGVVLPESDP